MNVGNTGPGGVPGFQPDPSSPVHSAQPPPASCSSAAHSKRYIQCASDPSCGPIFRRPMCGCTSRKDPLRPETTHWPAENGTT